jgi:hypothetical protein
MRNSVVKNLITIFFLLIYINRGLFVSDAYEMENPNGELNSVVELLVELITGEGNDIDEDGDVQTDFSYVTIVQHDFAQSFEAAKLFSKDIEKNRFPIKENFPVKGFYFQIDHPPEV